MKTLHVSPIWYAGVIIFLALAVFFTGCTQPSTQSTAITTAPTTGQGLKAPVQTAVAPMINASLPYGVTISYPNDWERQDVNTSGVRDYGKNTVNVANFYSPNEIPGDTFSYNSLSIDVDQNVQADFDTYFNQATLAIGKTYDPQMEAHSYTLKIAGYDSYELDFQTKDVKGSYIFTNANGSIYIFAFKSPTKPIAIRALSDEIVDMYKSIQLNPPVTIVPKQR
ncbi:MAG: hypothetical protein NTZ39_09170 [Methanoregula sp.]|nr:hypothetical protein [Methanoregula sp.]